MRSYDGKSDVDFKGRNMGKGAKGGSMLGEFFPPEVKATSMKPPKEIKKPRYPDTAEAIFDEQEGNVSLADKDKASAKRRK